MNQQDSLEVFQRAMIILYDKIMQRKLDHLEVPLKSYLYGICKNLVKEHKRKFREYVEFESNTTAFNHLAEENAEEAKTKDELIDQLVQFINKIGPPCKTILELFYYQRMRMEQIAEKLEYKNPDTVKTKKYKCIKRLQSLFSDHKTMRT